MRRRLFRGAIFCLLLYWLLIGTITHLPATKLPHVTVSDKLEHFAAFMLLGFLLNVVLHQFTHRHADWLTLLIILIYGALDELLQPLTGRTCDLTDWLADGTGAAAGVVLCNMVRSVWMFAGRKTAGQMAGARDDSATKMTTLR